VIRKEKKTRKYRGNRFSGYGQQGQHRSSGQRGGAGRAGYEKQHWIRTVKYEKERIKRRGFTRPERLVHDYEILNLYQLEEAVPFLLKNNLAKLEGKIVSLDLAEIGVSKLLGKGKITKAFMITVKSASSKAIEKVEENGGQITLTKPEVTSSVKMK